LLRGGFQIPKKRNRCQGAGASIAPRRKTSKGDPAMRRRFLPITVVLILAGAPLAASGCENRARQTGRAVIPVSAPADAAPGGRGAKVYEGRIKDVRPVWGILVLTVGEGKKARDIRFDMTDARIVGPSGNEWKGQDIYIGDRVRVRLTAGGKLVQQITVLPDRANGLNNSSR
jgi:hypothetical protein